MKNQKTISLEQAIDLLVLNVGSLDLCSSFANMLNAVIIRCMMILPVNCLKG